MIAWTPEGIRCWQRAMRCASWWMICWVVNPRCGSWLMMIALHTNASTPAIRAEIASNAMASLKRRPASGRSTSACTMPSTPRTVCKPPSHLLRNVWWLNCSAPCCCLWMTCWRSSASSSAPLATRYGLGRLRTQLHPGACAGRAGCASRLAAGRRFAGGSSGGSGSARGHGCGVRRSPAIAWLSRCRPGGFGWLRQPYVDPEWPITSVHQRCHSTEKSWSDFTPYRRN